MISYQPTHSYRSNPIIAYYCVYNTCTGYDYSCLYAV